MIEKRPRPILGFDDVSLEKNRVLPFPNKTSFTDPQ